MEPVSPVSPTLNLPEVTFAADKPEYRPLPAYKTPDGMVVTRWRLTWRERLKVLTGGNLWLSVLTFNRPLQPVKIETEFPLAAVVCRDEHLQPARHDGENLAEESA